MTQDPNSLEPSSESSAPGSQPSSPPPEKKGQRTILDLAACRDVAMKQLGFKKAKVEEQLKEKAAEPAKLIELIEKFRNASPCSSQWVRSESGDKVQACKQCKLDVYDFSHMTDEEAKDFVAKCGISSNVTFFKRRDGKYLLSDCPVGAKQKQVKISLIAGILAALGAIVVFSLLNSASQPVATQPESAQNAMTLDGSKLMSGSSLTSAEPASASTVAAKTEWKRAKATDYWSKKTDDFWRNGAKRGEVDIGRGEAIPPENQAAASR